MISYTLGQALFWTAMTWCLFWINDRWTEERPLPSAIMTVPLVLAATAVAIVANAAERSGT